MNTKQIISLAIIATLPFGALADYNYTINGLTYHTSNSPASISAKEIAQIAETTGPYVSATIQDDDDEHIASTAYVKGAYNDMIRAANRLGLTKQDVFDIDDQIDPYTEIEGAIGTDSFFDALDNPEAYVSSVVNAAAIVRGIKSQRAEVYTNWDDDTAKTEVAFVTASQE